MISPVKYDSYHILKERNRSNYNGFLGEISGETKFLMIKFFKTLIENECQIEAGREFLINKNMNSNDSYELIKGNVSTAYITRDHFKNFLEDMCIFPSNFENEVLFSRFDKNHDGKVTFLEVNINC